MAENKVRDAYLGSGFDGAENDPQYLLVVKNLKKYFPIKGGMVSR